MTDTHPACEATTQAGRRCKNSARPRSRYCHVHQNFLPVEIPLPVSTTPQGTEGKSQEREHFEMLVQEFNALAEEIKRSYPDFVPPEFSAAGMIAMLKTNLAKLTPGLQSETLVQLRANLEGTTPQDLIDPDTWKGLWYILNYTAQAQSRDAIEKISTRLGAIPGYNLMVDLKGNLEGTSPREFLDADTWKGLFLVMSYSARATVNDVKRRVLGEDDAGEIEE